LTTQSSNDNTRKVFTAGDVYAYIDDDGTVEIPYGYTEIEPWAFHYALDVNNVIIPDTVENIGCGAFYGCIYLSEVVVPNSIQYMGEGVFLTTRNTCIIVTGCNNDEDKNRMIDVIIKIIHIVMRPETLYFQIKLFYSRHLYWWRLLQYICFFHRKI